MLDFHSFVFPIIIKVKYLLEFTVGQSLRTSEGREDLRQFQGNAVLFFLQIVDGDFFHSFDCKKEGSHLLDVVSVNLK